MSKIITLGIGPDSDITSLVLMGLDVAIVYTGISSNVIKRQIAALDVDTRPAMYQSSAVGLESGEGAWLFEDGTRMVWDTLTGDEGTIKRNVSGLVQ